MGERDADVVGRQGLRVPGGTVDLEEGASVLPFSIYTSSPMPGERASKTKSFG